MLGLNFFEPAKSDRISKLCMQKQHLPKSASKQKDLWHCLS